MKDKFIDYFIILEVHYFASDDVIKAAYKRLCQKHHPDAGGTQTHFQQLQVAYETLSHPHRKKVYLKEWIEHYTGRKDLEMDFLKPSIYEITFHYLKEIILKYLTYIREEEYALAYEMLSEDNKKRLFVKDFIQWQKLISEIHRLLDFDSVIDHLKDEKGIKGAIMKVRVKEYNQLLHRVETDYFYRELIYEDQKWCIHLKHVDVRATIKKYKKILVQNRKSTKLWPKLMHKIDENHNTKFVSKKYFINNCEYEWLRFTRYGRGFSILSVEANTEKLFNDLEQIIFEETRVLDTYCIYSKYKYYILLPETQKKNGTQIVSKFLNRLTDDQRKALRFRISESMEKYENIKEMLDRL